MQKDGWKYVCFKDHRDKAVVIDWITSKLSKKAWMNLKRALENLAQRPINDWHKPHPSSKISNSNHIYVIRFSDENRTQWRIYGFHKVSKCVFVMTNYGTERGNKYEPSAPDSRDKAEECMELCNSCWEQHVCNCLSNLSDTLSIARDAECADK